MVATWWSGLVRRMEDYNDGLQYIRHIIVGSFSLMRASFLNANATFLTSESLNRTITVDASASDLVASIARSFGACEKVVAVTSSVGPNAPLELGVSIAIETEYA